MTKNIERQQTAEKAQIPAADLAKQEEMHQESIKKNLCIKLLNSANGPIELSTDEMRYIAELMRAA